MSLRTRRSLALLTATMMVVVACTGAPVASPTAPAGTTAPVATDAPTTAPGESPAETTAPGTDAPATDEPGESPAASPAESPAGSPTGEGGSLVYVIDGEITYLTNANSDVPTANAVQWLYDGLFALDNTITPVPNLAAGEPEFSEDGLSATIRLVDNAVFQPTGEPVRATDVVFTWEMSFSDNCRFNPATCYGQLEIPDPETGELVKVFEGIEEIDELTVQFNLNTPYAPLGLALTLPIESRAATEAAFATFQEAAANVTIEDVNALEERIAAEEANPTGPPDPEAEDPEAPTPNLVQFRSDLEALLQTASIELPPQASYTVDGVFDEALYTNQEVVLLRDLKATLEAEAGDQIAAAYPLLSVQRAPVGSGPFYVSEFNPGQNLTLDRNEQYHRGVPALEQMFLPIIKDQVARASALVAGDIDWTQDLDADAYAAVQGNPNVKIAEYADFAIFGVQFNLREGAIWAEKEMRQASAHCIDKEAMVDAANEGQAVVAHADLPPASWGYNPDIPIYELDVARANELITGLGYTQGADGVYERDGTRLATTILVRAGQPARIRFMQFFADALNQDCGFDITVQEADFSTVLLPMLEYPHTNPPTGRPFDAYFGGWGNYGIDPDPYSIFHSSQCTTEDQPDLYNYICFQNEEADRIIEQQIVELDFDARRELIQQFELIMAEELPYLWAWAPVGRQGLRTTVNQTDQEWTPEVMDSQFWYWEAHKITNAE